MTITEAPALGALAFVATGVFYYSTTSSQKTTAAAKPLSPEQQCDAALLMEHATTQMNEIAHETARPMGGRSNRLFTPEINRRTSRE